jgi:hypothetical protein
MLLVLRVVRGSFQLPLGCVASTAQHRAVVHASLRTRAPGVRVCVWGGGGTLGCIAALLKAACSWARDPHGAHVGCAHRVDGGLSRSSSVVSMGGRRATPARLALFTLHMPPACTHTYMCALHIVC